MARVSASAHVFPVPPASLHNSCSALVLLNFSPIQVFSLHYRTHPVQPNRVVAKYMGARFPQCLGCWEAPEQKCELDALSLLIPHTPSQCPRRLPKLELLILCLELSTMNVTRTALSLSPTRTSLPSLISQVLPLTSTAYSVISCWDLSMVQ